MRKRRHRNRPRTNKMKVLRFRHAKTPHSLKYTIKLIGDGIKNATGFVPIRQYAAAVASRAPARHFLSQLGEIYDDFTRKRWRYVFDPVGYELVGITGPVVFDSILGFGVTPPSRGFGDCDEATAGIASVAQNVGLPARMVTIAGPNTRGLFDHIFPQVLIPKKGWVTADPVVYPKHGMGWTAPHKRWAAWDLDAYLMGYGGIFPGPLANMFKQMVRFQP